MSPHPGQMLESPLTEMDPQLFQQPQLRSQQWWSKNLSPTPLRFLLLPLWGSFSFSSLQEPTVWLVLSPLPWLTAERTLHLEIHFLLTTPPRWTHCRSTQGSLFSSIVSLVTWDASFILTAVPLSGSAHPFQSICAFGESVQSVNLAGHLSWPSFAFSFPCLAHYDSLSPRWHWVQALSAPFSLGDWETPWLFLTALFFFLAFSLPMTGFLPLTPGDLPLNSKPLIVSVFCQPWIQEAV